MKLDRFINRPVLSTVISILIVILGILGLLSLPITQYPDIAPPTVSVKATYTGANAQTVLNSVIAPLEDQINGVENMMYMTSSASNNGAAEISIYFKQGTDPDMAAVNVQNRVSMAQGLLPAEVTQIGVTTQKRQNSMLIVFSVYDAEDRYDQRFIENYAKINLIPEVQRVPGVGDANVLGTDYSMRIWLKPDVMAQYKLVPNDVAGVLAEQNVEAAPGSFGERGNQSFQYTIRYKGRLQEVSEFENMVVKALPDGEVLRLKDIADIELGRLTYNYADRYLGTYTYRYDGSSNFGPENRWAGFHSLATSWRFSNETFFEPLKKVISNGKLRLGWGQTGNANIGGYAWGTSMSRMPSGLGMGYRPSNIPNTSIKWESQEQWNVGVDLGFLHDRINLTVEWYKKTSSDMLMPLQLPSYMGTSGNASSALAAPKGNYGDIENTGFEISLNTHPITGKFEWDSDFQISFNKNKLKGLAGTANAQIVGYGQWTDVVSVSSVGESLYNFYGFVCDGVYKDLEGVSRTFL